MKKPFFIILIVLFTSGNIFSQNPFGDQNASFWTEDGYELELEKAEALLESELFYLVRKKDEDGNLLYVFKRYNAKNVKSSADTLFIENSSGKIMPDYQLLGMDKAQKTKRNFRGKITVYNFWYTGCKPCLEEMPLLNMLAKDFKGEINFVAPTFENLDKVNDFLAENQFDYYVLTNAQELADELKISSYPTHVITDENGVIKKIFFGGSNIIDLEIRGVISQMRNEAINMAKK